MKPKAYQSAIPAGAREEVEKRYPSGAKQSAWYWLGGEKVGYRLWVEEGWLEWEYALRHGVKHGPEYWFFADEWLLSKETYVAGRVHGKAWQWAEDGRVLVTYRMRHGVGLDLWCDTETGTLAEEWYWPAVGQRGYSRHWNEDERTVYEEYFFVGSKGYHGVWREWNRAGRLRRGFPRFYVNDVRVTRRQYVEACRHDPRLVSYKEQDDDPHRPLPQEYTRQRRARA